MQQRTKRQVLTGWAAIDFCCRNNCICKDFETINKCRQARIDYREHQRYAGSNLCKYPGYYSTSVRASHDVNVSYWNMKSITILEHEKLSFYPSATLAEKYYVLEFASSGFQ